MKIPIRIWEKLGSKVAWFGVDIFFGTPCIGKANNP